MTDSAAHGTNEGALWGARFATGPSPELQELSRSTHFDWALALYDLRGSHAHARALGRAGYLTADEEARMHAGLDALGEAVRSGELVATESDEDVHGALEAALIREVGSELGGKLRAGRSRNDQIATLVRLFLLDHSRVIARVAWKPFMPGSTTSMSTTSGNSLLQTSMPSSALVDARTW